MEKKLGSINVEFDMMMLIMWSCVEPGNVNQMEDLIGLDWIESTA